MRIILLLVLIPFFTIAVYGQRQFHMAKDTVIQPEGPSDLAAINTDSTYTPEDSISVIDSLTRLDSGLTELSIRGNVYTALITEDGDTLIMDVFNDISITSMRSFADEADYKKYQKQRRYANIVYPYAREAIRIFRELEWAEENMDKKERKKRIKELQEELKQEFEAPLSRLTKLQGKILIKMIELELNETMYNLIKGLRGRFTAFYWHNFSKLYSYDLKEGYNHGKYPILDAVLSDFDVSYRIENEESLKYLKRKK